MMTDICIDHTVTESYWGSMQRKHPLPAIFCTMSTDTIL